MEQLKEKIKKELENFYLSNCQLEGVVGECEPLGYSLEGCENLEDLETWLGDYIFNIGDQIDLLKQIKQTLDEIQDEVIEMEEK